MDGITGIGATAGNPYTSEVQEVNQEEAAKETQTTAGSSTASTQNEEDAYIDTSDMVDDTDFEAETKSTEAKAPEDDGTYTYYSDGRKAGRTTVDENGETKKVTYNYDTNNQYSGKTVEKGDRTTEYNSENKKVSSTRTYADKDGYQLTEDRTYDENGKINKRTITNSKGETVQEDTDYVYNADGKVQSKKVTKNGKTETRTYTYNKNGKKETMSTGNKTVYYDENGNKTKTEKKYTTGGKSYVETIKYDENGKVKSKVIKDADGNVVSKHKDYEYNENGKVKSKTITKNGKTRQIEYTYDKDGNLATRTVKDKGGNILKESKYSDYSTDDKGRTTRNVEVKDGNGEITGYRKQTLGENGKTIESKKYDKDNKLESKTFKDENGQISRIMTYGSWEKGEDGTRVRKCEIKNANGEIVGYRIDTKDKDGNVSREFQNSKGKESKRSAVMYD